MTNNNENIKNQPIRPVIQPKPTNAPIRHIRIVRNQAGFGFTLSRYVIYPDYIDDVDYESQLQLKPLYDQQQKINSTILSSKNANCNVSSSPLSTLSSSYSSSAKIASSSSPSIAANTLDANKIKPAAAATNLNTNSCNSFQVSNNENINKPNEIVFVKHVRIDSAAYIAGLREGDRLISINSIPLHDKNYSDIILIIENSGNILDLNVTAGLLTEKPVNSTTTTQANSRPSAANSTAAKTKTKSLSADLSLSNLSSHVKQQQQLQPQQYPQTQPEAQKSDKYSMTSEPIKQHTSSKTPFLPKSHSSTSASSTNFSYLINDNAIKASAKHANNDRVSTLVKQQSSPVCPKSFNHNNNNNNNINNNSFGLTSLGMSALFYSFLKNNHKASPVDSGYDSKHDQSLNNSAIISTTSGSSNKLSSKSANSHSSNALLASDSKTRNLTQQSTKPSPPKQTSSLISQPAEQQTAATRTQTSTPITQLKLKNLQEALIKHYSKDQLSKLGIVIPDLNAKPTDKLQKFYDNYENFYLGGDAAGKYPSDNNNQNQSNENEMADSTEHPFYFAKGNENPMATTDKPSQWFYSLNRNNSYSDKVLSSNKNNNNTTNINSKQQPQVDNLKPLAGQKVSTAPSQSTTSLVSTSTASSSSTLSTIQHVQDNSTNSESTLNENNNNNTATNNNIFSDLTGAKQSPHVFSRYIESVHKALYGKTSKKPPSSSSTNINDHDRRPNMYRSSSVASSGTTTPTTPTTPNESPNGQPTMTFPTDYETAQKMLQYLNPSCRIVENRRQLFEKSKSECEARSDAQTTNTLKRSEDIEQLKNQLKNASLNVNMAALSLKQLNEQTNQLDFNSKAPFMQQQNTTKPMSSLNDITNQQNKPSPDKTNINSFSTINVPFFNHTNRSSYKGECKRLMSRANMETVAERASRFEDIDYERYNRMKSKFTELETYQEQELKNQMLKLQQDRLNQQILLRNVTNDAPNTDNNSQIADFPNLKAQPNKNSSSDVKLPQYLTIPDYKYDYYWSQEPDTENNNPRTASKNENITQYENAAYRTNPNKKVLLSKLDQMYQMGDDSLDSNERTTTTAGNEDDLTTLQMRMSKRRSITTSPVRYSFSGANFAAAPVRFEANFNPTTGRTSDDHQHPSKTGGGLYLMNSENTGETSTDSDIGTSPSGTTFASPPSSPQQTNNNPQTHHHNQSVKTHSKNPNNPGGVAQQPVHFFNPNNNNSASATQRAGFYYSDPKTDSQSNSNNNNNNKHAKSQMPDQHHFMFNLNYDQKPAEKFLIDAAMSNNTSSNNINSNSNSKSAASTAGQADLNNPNSVIRQHSYLNAVQLNDYKLNQQKQFRFNSMLNENDFIPTQLLFDPASDPYYYSPSSTLMRQQKLLQFKQQQQFLQQQQQKLQQLQQQEDQLLKAKANNYIDKPAKSSSGKVRSKSSSRVQNTDSKLSLLPVTGEQSSAAAASYINPNNMVFNDTFMSNSLFTNQVPEKQPSTSSERKETHKRFTNRHSSQPTTTTSTSSTSNDPTFSSSTTNLEGDENRRVSYLKATSKTPETDTSKKSGLLSPSSQQSSRNTSIKKLKNFFGEKQTPIILQAVENNKNVIASDDYLSTLLETIKEGVLNCKIVLKDGKRSSDRSWRPAWAVLKKSGALFLCKEKKDNVMIPSVDSYPINLKNSTIDIAYDYTKRKNVFKLNTFSNSEYLFQTIDNDSMLEWIKAMQDNSTPPDLDKLMSGSSSVFSTNSSASSSVKQQRFDSPVSEQAAVAAGYFNNRLSNELISSTVTSSSSPPGVDDYANISPNRGLKSEESSPRRDTITSGSTNNRKWVRQMTRRIRDFVTNTYTNDLSSSASSSMAGAGFEISNNDELPSTNRNFGVALTKCESSSISPFIPVVIEICTRLIELHINDEGLYRKVGQKQVVLSLRSQLNNGVLNIDVTDINWNNPHAVVSLLKFFLNELPDSLTTSLLYIELIKAARIDNHQMRLFSIKKTLVKLPKHNYETLKYLTAHLRRVAAAYQHNKMTIKNLCIAFSQSVVRHNDANCETIKSDHLYQSLLIELILIYHDWFFDLSQMENIPNEIMREPIEEHLFASAGSGPTPESQVNYADLLSNIMKLIRTRWNLTNSSLVSSNSSKERDTNNTNNNSSTNINANNDSINSGENSNSSNSLARQPINIQFRSGVTKKPNVMKQSKKPLIQNSSASKLDERPSIKSSSTSVKKQKQKSSASLTATSNEQKQRSRSVDTKFRSFFGSSGSTGTSYFTQIVNSFNLDGAQSNLATTTTTTTTTKTSNNNNNHMKRACDHSSTHNINRASISKFSLSGISSRRKSSSSNCEAQPPALSLADENEFESQTKPVYYKQLEEKNEQDRQKLNEIMKQLDAQLLTAKMDLIQDDCQQNANLNANQPTRTSAKTARRCAEQPGETATQVPMQCLNTASKFLSSSFSSSSTTSGVLVNGEFSSSSSCAISKSPLDAAGAKTDARAVVPRVKRNDLNSLSSISSSSEDIVISPKLTAPQKTPSKRTGHKSNGVNRRHTIASANFLADDDDEDESDDVKVEPKPPSPPRRAAIFKKLRKIKPANTNDILKLLHNRNQLTASKSISSLPSMNRTSQTSNHQLFYSKQLEKEEQQVKRTILNLSPLSISASSISSSSSSNSLTNNNQPMGIKQLQPKQVLVTNIANEVGSIGIAINQLSLNNLNSCCCQSNNNSNNGTNHQHSEFLFNQINNCINLSSNFESFI